MLLKNAGEKFLRVFLPEQMIETERLQLIACNKMHLNALMQSEQALGDLLGVEFAENWLVFPETLDMLPYALKMLEKDPQVLRWGMHLFLKKDENKIIGNGGFKGVADEQGMVEIGYAISPLYEHQGLATEAARGMIEYAFSWSPIKMVDAHTLAEENASVRILQKCGMTRIAEKHDTEDGDIWQWRILREDFEKAD
ncbi:MAG TPA: GNAT family N-acetyltransferase [Pyrinomonadaceae bacterium]|jgi:RimJ/RimL family protein N-acetyltransferase|nr:GNAT family N-acetyltransferase [Pyrinomonadaceae bacterium]